MCLESPTTEHQAKRKTLFYTHNHNINDGDIFDSKSTSRIPRGPTALTRSSASWNDNEECSQRMTPKPTEAFHTDGEAEGMDDLKNRWDGKG